MAPHGQNDLFYSNVAEHPLKLACLNINSLKIKFQGVREIISSTIEIWLVWETKANEKFPQITVSNCQLPICTKIYKTCFGNGLCLYLNKILDVKQ